MGVGEPIRDIGIGMAEDMGNAKFIADDLAVVRLCGRRHGCASGQRIPDHAGNRNHGDDYQEPRTDLTKHAYPSRACLQCLLHVTAAQDRGQTLY